MVDPYKMTNIKFVRGCSNFVQFSNQKIVSSHNLEYLTQKTKKSGQLIVFQKVWKILFSFITFITFKMIFFFYLRFLNAMMMFKEPFILQLEIKPIGLEY